MKTPFFVCFFSLYSLLAFGQDAFLKKEIDAIIHQYEKAEKIHIRFDIKVYYPNSTQETMEGAFYQVKPFYGVHFNEYQIFSDGKTQWTIFKESQEVQITSVDPEGAELASPAGIIKYLSEHQFKYFDKSAMANDPNLLLIELIPVDKSDDYFKIRITKEKTTQNLKFIEVFSRDGTRFQMTLNTVESHQEWNEKFYRWNQNNYKDYYIEDLRID